MLAVQGLTRHYRGLTRGTTGRRWRVVGCTANGDDHGSDVTLRRPDACRGSAGQFLSTGLPRDSAPSTRSRDCRRSRRPATFHGENDNNERTGSSHLFPRRLNYVYRARTVGLYRV